MAETTDNAEQVITCHYHPARQAFVHCGKCERPLCPECVQHGVVGIRCIECLLGITIRPLTMTRRVVAVGAALATGLIIGGGLGWLALLNFITAFGLGLAVGQATRYLVRYTMTPGMQAAAGIASVFGAYAGAVANGAMRLVRAGAPPDTAFRLAAAASPVEWLLPALVAAGMAIYWVRR